jgi:hypothetical protein
LVQDQETKLPLDKSDTHLNFTYHHVEHPSLHLWILLLLSGLRDLTITHFALFLLDNTGSFWLKASELRLAVAWIGMSY